MLEKCIRRINLDAFWSQASSTIYKNKRQLINSVEMSSMVGLQGSYEHICSYDLEDQCGYEVTIAILLYSLKKDNHDKAYTQFETIRKLRSVYSNHCRKLPLENKSQRIVWEYRRAQQQILLRVVPFRRNYYTE